MTGEVYLPADQYFLQTDTCNSFSPAIVCSISGIFSSAKHLY
jgi:hypothetical protein